MRYKKYTYLFFLFLFLSFRAFAQPNTISGLQLWLSAELLVTHSGGSVSEWGDLSGNNFNATQLDVTKQPTLISNITELNNKPVIRFDGINDFMSFTSLNVRTVFFVVKHANGTNSYNTLLGNSTSYHWHGGAGSLLFNNYAQTAPIISGQTYLNNVQISTLAIEKPTQYSVLTVVTNANQPAERITGDDPSQNGSSFWEGDYAEIIIYDRPLSLLELTTVSNYLFDKYAPAVSLGADINQTDSFCPITIDAGSNFKSYTWSNGASTSSISVTSSGTYSVITTDIFGRLSTDEIVVNFPLINLKPDTTVCYNTEFRWNTLLNTTDYTFAWSNGDSDSQTFFNPTATTTLNCVISDLFTCSYTTPVITITVDDFSQTATLGSDVALCEGNSIGLINALNVSSYNWMPGNLSTPTITITTAGTYSVQATNTLGCELNDEIVVSIIGSAPTADFTFNTTCIGSNMELTSLSVAPSGNAIVSYTWNFGEPASGSNNAGFIQNPTHTYLLDGVYDVFLEVETEIGCKQNITREVTVYPLPFVDFVSYPACVNSKTIFKDLSDGVGYPINEWDWNFGDVSSPTNTSNSAETDHTYSMQSTFVVSLTVTTIQGCYSSTSKSIFVNPSPTIDFLTTPLCLGSVTTFTNATVMPFPQTIQSQEWSFGDGNYAFAPINFHTYAASGNYTVKLQVLSSIGCTHVFTKTLLVTPNPSANFLYSNNCLNGLTFFESKSTTLLSSITTLKWEFDNTIFATSNATSYTFNSVGNKNIKLTAVNTNGCQNSVIKTILVKPLPIASFVYTPSFISPGEKVVFNNVSQNSVSYTWAFGNGFSSYIKNPITLFPDSGMYVVSIVAKDENGCKDSISKSIDVLFSKLDLGIFTLKAEINSDNFLDLSIELINFGTKSITDFKLLSAVNSESLIRESWKGELKRGQRLMYNFSSSVQLNDVDSVNAYVCVEIAEVNSLKNDDDLTNNKKCISFRADRFIVLPGFPNPAENIFTLPVILPQDGNVMVEVFNDLGELVFDTYTVTGNKGLNSIELDVNYLERGLYFYRIRYNEKIARNKFMIIK